FGGKEKESWQDLGSSDFGARIYQPALAEFDSGDPMMEKYYPWTIYSYCSANPVNRIDPDGMDWIQDRYGSYLFDNNATSQETTRYGWTYIGASLPEDVSRYRILEEIDGFLYHKNTTNLFALIVNGIAGKDIMVEKKAYDPAGDYMTASAIESLGWIAAGGALNKLVSKAAPKVFPAAGSEGVTVVGEGMARVEQAASKIPGARILNDMPAFTGTAEQITSQMMQYNRRWLLDAMRSGRPIIDIGKDLHQINPSIFYQMEQNMMKNYQILHPNKLIITRP
ncbi:MAG: hypothetical protein LBN29_03315, partial [Mediterranea sp.]|nr:hypothetical protein [Mediterranea sp.]